jgi:hypothetical protein
LIWARATCRWPGWRFCFSLLSHALLLSKSPCLSIYESTGTMACYPGRCSYSPLRATYPVCPTSQHHHLYPGIQPRSRDCSAADTSSPSNKPCATVLSYKYASSCGSYVKNHLGRGSAGKAGFLLTSSPRFSHCSRVSLRTLFSARATPARISQRFYRHSARGSQPERFSVTVTVPASSTA